MSRDDLTVERLKQLLHYDPDSGVFTRIKSVQGQKSGIIAGNISDGRLRIAVDGYSYKGHRLAFLYMKGRWPDNEIDHIDRNPLNNKWDNLREATSLENKRNMKKIRDNEVGMTGVRIEHRSKTNPYSARIRVNYKTIHLGMFPTIEAASAAYKLAAEKYHGDFVPCPTSMKNTSHS